jgi:hypothetical protein
MINNSEDWRPVVGLEGAYEVSSLGRVRGLPRPCTPGGVMAQNDRGDAKGYLRVQLSRYGKRRVIRVHRVVVAAFLGPRPAGLVTRHLDGDKHNNAVSNLVFGTGSENTHDSVAHGGHYAATRTHCPQGHPYDHANTYHYTRADGGPSRGCRECRAAAGRRRYERRLAG